MVAIRLSRTGAKKKPSYRVVVTDKRRARDSRNLEIVGHYNPRPDPIEVVLKRDRIDYWLGVGAQPSDTVRRLMRHYDALAPAEPVVEEDVAPAEEAQPEPEAEAVAEAKPAAPGQPVDADEDDGAGADEADAQFDQAVREEEIQAAK